MMLDLIQQFGDPSLALGIAWPLSPNENLGCRAERKYQDVHLQCKLQGQVQRPSSPWSVLDANIDSFPACPRAFPSK